MSNQGDQEEGSFVEQEASDCNITNEDLDAIATLVDVIKEIYQDVDPENLESISETLSVTSILQVIKKKLIYS